MFRFLSVAAALSAGLAAWLSQGTIGFTAADGPRLGVLSSSAGALVIPAIAAAAVLALARAGASLVPLALLTFVALPWLPFRVPSAFLLWVWPLTLVVWAGVLLLMVASLPAWRRVAPSLATAARPRVAAGVLACAVFGLSAWRVAPLIPAGDEPHYLVITQSLLLDGDLTIEDVHRRADYRAYYDAELQPHVQRLGRDGRIYSIHAPGLPAIIAPAFAIGGYPAAVFFLILLASAGSALAWHLGWLWTGRTDAAWFGWAAVTLPVTTIFQSFTIYPDGLGGVVALTGLWALLRAALESRNGSESAKPWLAHGAALALLPWLHSRFAVLAAGLGALVLLRLSTTKNPAAKAVAFLSIPAASAIVWVGYFIALYGSADPSSPYAPGTGSFQWVPGGLAGLLFDQRFGVLTYAPVLGLALIGLGAMLVKPGSRRLGLELVFVIAPYLLTVTHFAMWWGGWSAPARFFAPILFLLAVPAASFWVTFESRVSRTVASTALALTAIASLFVVGVDRGRLAFNTREAPALWLEWFGRVADLTAATPLWARGADGPLFRAIAVWLLLAVAVWALLRFLDRSGKVGDRIAFYTVTAAAIAIAAMVASTVVWAFEGSSGRSVVRSQLRVLDAVAAGSRALALQLDPFATVPADRVAGRLRIEQVRRPGRRPGGEAMSLFALPSLPAGRYRIHVEADDPRGWLMMGIVRESRDPFALRTVQLPAPPVDFDFPLPIRTLVIRGDEDAWRAVRGIVVEPLEIRRGPERLTDDTAIRAVRYRDATAYFLDDRAYPEPEAFWVRGARESRVALQSDTPRPAITLRIRNAPVANRVVLASGGWREEFVMAPGEEKLVAVPVGASRGSALVRIETEGGFRPAEQDPASRDQRFLGVWIRIEP